MQLVLLDCANVAFLHHATLALQRLCSSSHHPDASEEKGDEVDSHEDELVMRQRQQVLNKQLYEGDLDEILFGGVLPTTEKIGDPLGAELIPNPPSCPSLPCVGGDVQEPGPNLSGTKQLIYRINLLAAMDIKSRIEKRISKCLLEDLALLEEDLVKLASAIEHKLSPKIGAKQLAVIDLSIAQAWSSQQAASEGYQVTWTFLSSIQARLETLVREQEQLETEASRLHGVLSEQEAILSHHQDEILRLKQQKGAAMEVPTLSLTNVEILRTLEGLLEDHRRSFRDIAFK
ncbi:hypothetical protein FF2_029767 [Malus domestica]